MKKVIKAIVVMIISMNFTIVYATSGALKSNSIKTCPDGKMYGYHGADNHWHEAEYTPRDSGSNYSAVGEPLPSDPCPKEEITTKNESEETSTTQYTNNDNNNYEEESNNTSSNYNYTVENTFSENDEQPSQSDNETIETVEKEHESNLNIIDDNSNTETNETEDNDSFLEGLLGLGIIGGVTAAVATNKKKKK